MIKAAVFDTKPYDVPGLEKYGKEQGVEFKFYETKLTEDTVDLARGFEAVVVFVNDVLNEKVIELLASYSVKLIALRCAGFNNVDLKAAEGKIAFSTTAGEMYLMQVK